MRLSEAIRLGALLNPQGFGEMKEKDGRTCALGAALEAMGALQKDVRTNWLFPVLKMYVTCPAGDGHAQFGETSLDAMIIHLNDFHKWTREEIADWVEVQEVRQEKEVKEHFGVPV